MDVFKNIFNNPLRDKYKNTFDEDEMLGDYSINFRSMPTQERLIEIGNDFVDICVRDLKLNFGYIQTLRTEMLSKGYISKRKLFFFKTEIPIAVGFVDVRDKGFIVEDYCIKLSLDTSMLTGTYKFNSFVTTKEELIEFVKTSLYA